MSSTPRHLFRRSISQKHCPVCGAACPSDNLFCIDCGASIVKAPRVNRTPAKTTPQQFQVPTYLSRDSALFQYDDTPMGTGLVWLGLILIAIPTMTRNISPISVGAWIAGLAAVVAGIARTRSDGQALLRAGLATGVAAVISLGVIGQGLLRGPDTSLDQEQLAAVVTESPDETESGMSPARTFDGSVPTLRGSAAHVGENPGPLLEGNPYRAWRYDTGQLLNSTPAIVEGSAYFGTRDGYLIALDLLTAMPRWTFDLSGYPVSSAPAYSNRTIYVGSGYHVYAIDAERGTERWQFEMSYAGESSPTVAEGVVYVASKEHVLYALDAETGEKIWSYRTDGLIYGSPTLSDELVLIGTDEGHIFAISRQTGFALWKHTAASGVYSTISVDDGLALVTLFDQSVIALDLRTGAQVWEFPVGGSASPAIRSSHVYVGSADGAVYALDAKEGGPPAWLFPTGNGQVQSPVIVGETLVFAAGPTLYAVERATGELLWQYPIGSPATTEPVVVDGMIYIGAEDGNLYAIAGDASLLPDDEENGARSPKF
ncbi:MAG: PQQ-binding-like beta-propeller repeat protein [Thermomicrobiales bacterium]|nr:PQQ-binding-like beta-propeller repeat protein [Thermomicrobiales bacterium]